MSEFDPAPPLVTLHRRRLVAANLSHSGVDSSLVSALTESNVSSKTLASVPGSLASNSSSAAPLLSLPRLRAGVHRSERRLKSTHEEINEGARAGRLILLPRVIDE